MYKILEILAGSHSYGTNIEGSDVDKRGIFVLPEKTIITKFNYVEELAGMEPDDFRYYELSKYINLLSKQNPNIMEILWTDNESLINVTEAGLLLKKHRESLLSKEVSQTYVMYAISQLKRIKGHKKMIMKPQKKEPPEIKEFVKISYNLTENQEYNKEIPKSGYVLYKHDNNNILAFSVEKFKTIFPKLNPQEGLFLDNGALRLREKNELNELQKKHITPDIILSFNHNLYDEKFLEWKTYWSWVENRNPARSELEIKYGFDTKHAMHVIRLLRSGYEILTEGRVNVFRKDAKELLSIRRGEWSYEKILEEAEKMQEKINQVKSNLPDEINKEFLADLSYEIYKTAWKEMSLNNKLKLK